MVAITTSSRDFALPERASHQFLVRVRPIRLGRVEEGHAERDRAMDRRNRLTLVALVGRAVGLAHPHAAETDLGDGEALGAKRAGRQHGRDSVEG